MYSFSKILKNYWKLLKNYFHTSLVSSFSNSWWPDLLRIPRKVTILNHHKRTKTSSESSCLRTPSTYPTYTLIYKVVFLTDLSNPITELTRSERSTCGDIRSVRLVIPVYGLDQRTSDVSLPKEMVEDEKEGSWVERTEDKSGNLKLRNIGVPTWTLSLLSFSLRVLGPEILG